jgi:Leucine-rich repeat (LRR) protein
MEEYDDLSAGPTEDGKLDLSHNTWAVFPPELTQFSKRLLHLDMKNNRLTRIPECISSLTLLKSLDVSLNHIDYIDKGIGQCIRLRSLNVSRNRLESLPSNLSNCVMLEQIIADQNRLATLPETLIDLIAISIIDVRDNQLTSIPLGLCRVPTLNKIHCEGNNDLIVAPENMRDDTHLLFHCLEMQLKFKEAIATKSSQREELQDKADGLRDELNNATNRISELEKDILALEWERPDEYIRRKERVVELVGGASDKILFYLRLTKDVLLKWWNDRKTHPEYV